MINLHKKHKFHLIQVDYWLADLTTKFTSNMEFLENKWPPTLDGRAIWNKKIYRLLNNHGNLKAP